MTSEHEQPHDDGHTCPTCERRPAPQALAWADVVAAIERDHGPVEPWTPRREDMTV